jgi:hypothetical protein
MHIATWHRYDLRNRDCRARPVRCFFRCCTYDYLDVWEWHGQDDSEFCGLGAWPDDDVPDGGGDDGRDDESDNEGEGIGNEVLRCWPSFKIIDEGGF